MRRKLFAGIGAAGLLVLGFSPAAHAADQTITDTPPGGMIAVDLRSPSGVDSITRTFDVTAAGTVTNVTVTVDFMSSMSDSCTTQMDWIESYSNELGLVLVSPNMTEVELVFSSSSPNGPTFEYQAGVEPRVQVMFDDAATDLVGSVNSKLPITGVFQPVSPLSVLNGETAAGTWQLRVSDNDPGAAQCYYGATLNVTSDAVDQAAPTPPAKVETASR